MNNKLQCEACGSIENITKHHLRPKHLGGKDNNTNIIILCRRCHDIVDKDSSLDVSDISLIQKYPLLGHLFTNKVWNKMIYRKSKRAVKNKKQRK